jgi:RNA-directed DNA polymerase
MDTLTDQCQMKVSEMQRRLAQKATEQKAHRFTNLYDLLTWEPLLIWAFHTLMTNRGSRTAGIDGMDKRTAIKHQADILMELRAELKARAYRPQPVRRVYIPKANGKQRPLGMPMVRSYCPPYRVLSGLRYEHGIGSTDPCFFYCTIFCSR